MKIIKVLLILFPMLIGISAGGAFYYNNLASEVNIPERGNIGSCLYSEDTCSGATWDKAVEPSGDAWDKEVEPLVVQSFDIFSVEELNVTSDNVCLEKLKISCRAEKASVAKILPLIKAAEAEKQKNYDYGMYLLYAALTSGGLTLMSIVAYLAVKFSVVRTMAAVSIIWITISFFIQGYLMDTMLASSPVFLFWLYRFIRFGPSKMFKDK